MFGPIDLFVKRCKKLIELFTTIHQFSTLAQVTCPYFIASALVLPFPAQARLRCML